MKSKQTNTNTDQSEALLPYRSVLDEITNKINTDFAEFLNYATKADAQTLNSARVSVWFFTPDRSAIVCETMYKLSDDQYEKGVRLEAKYYPNYFNVINKNRVVPAHDAQNDPQTKEFTEGYLKTLGITSMMDTAIQHEGKIIGVVCHEHIGPKRVWTFNEQQFAGSVADLIARALEKMEKNKTNTPLLSEKASDLDKTS
jgi:GAF domain-containing protein